MSQAGQITFYTNVYSPYAQRVHIALEEAKAQYTSYTVNPMKKPDWYVSEVNPIGKIPAITYGGPPAPPDAPSPQSAKLSESLVILEFLADLFPAARLLPADPMQRARARFFARAYDERVFPASFRDFFFFASPLAPLLDALDTLQGLLPAEGFAAGEWSLADMAVGPFLARMWLFLEHDLGKGTVEDGRAALRELKGPRFVRLRRYLDDVKAQPSFQATWDEAVQLQIWGANPYMNRDAPERF